MSINTTTYGECDNCGINANLQYFVDEEGYSDILCSNCIYKQENRAA